MPSKEYRLSYNLEYFPHAGWNKSWTTFSDTNWDKVTSNLLSDLQRTIAYDDSIKTLRPASIIIKFGHYKAIPAEALQKFFTMLPSYVDKIIIPQQYINAYTTEELIKLGQSLKYLKILSLTKNLLFYTENIPKEFHQDSLVHPKVNHLIEHIGSASDNVLIEQELQKYLLPNIASMVTFFSYSERDSKCMDAKKKAKVNNARSLQPEKPLQSKQPTASTKDQYSFKLQCLYAFALIGVSVLCAGLIATSAPFIAAGIASLVLTTIFGVFNQLKDKPKATSPSTPLLKSS